MPYDFVMANQWLALGWLGAFLILLGSHVISSRLAAREDTDVRNGVQTVFGVLWLAFLVVTLLGFVWFLAANLVNWQPRQAPDRGPAERDQRSFERRFEE